MTTTTTAPSTGETPAVGAGTTVAPPVVGGRVRRIVRERRAQVLRYAGVSVVSTITSLTTLGLLVSTRTLTPGWANVVATALGTIPSFELNRRWVWARRGHRSAGREVGPFVALAFAGLVLSTVAVSMVGHLAEQMALTGLVRTVAIEGANLGAFGLLWIAQFVILDRVLFKDRQAP